MLAHRVRDASASGAISRPKDHEGDQSPGRIGRRPLETEVDGTDPSAEQRLEGAASRDPDTRVGAGNGADESIEATREANIKEATVVETRHGCGWGESSEGYEPHCEDAASA